MSMGSVRRPRKAGGIITSESEDQRTRGVEGINSSTRAEDQCPAQEGQQEENEPFLYLLFVLFRPSMK